MEHVKKLVCWLENQKIRHYKIEDRQGLHNIGSNQWFQVFDKYLQDVGCLINSNSYTDKIEWLVGLAVRMEYEDNSMFSINSTAYIFK